MGINEDVDGDVDGDGERVVVMGRRMRWWRRESEFGTDRRDVQRNFDMRW